MEKNFIIKKATKKDFNAWLELCRQLWPEERPSDFKVLFNTILKSARQIVLLGFSAQGEAIAFANISLRIDYVEGSDSSPIGYLEGIYVEKKFRKYGIARQLVKEAEKWAKKKGAKEMGSDTEAYNKLSQKFHKAIGFKETEKLVHFIKKI